MIKLLNVPPRLVKAQLLIVSAIQDIRHEDEFMQKKKGSFLSDLFDTFLNKIIFSCFGAVFWRFKKTGILCGYGFYLLH